MLPSELLTRTKRELNAQIPVIKYMFDLPRL